MRRPWFASAATLSLVALLLDLSANRSWPGLMAYVLAGAMATVVVGVNVATRPLWVRPAWLALTVALGALTLAWWTAGVGLAINQSATPSPLLPLAVFGPLALAAGLFVRANRSSRDASTVVDSLIVMASGGIVLIGVAIEPMLESGPDSAAHTFPIALGLALDLLLLSLATRLWLTPTAALNPAVRLVRWGLTLAIGAGILQHVGMALGLSAQEAPLLSITARALFVVSALLIGAASSSPSAVDVPEVVPVTPSVNRTRVLTLLAVALLSPLVIVVAHSTANFQVGNGIVISLMVLLGFLVAFRVATLVDGYGDALRRERVLRIIGRELGGAQEDSAISEVIDDHVGDLLAAWSLAAVTEAGLQPEAPPKDSLREHGFDEPPPALALTIPSRAPRLLHVWSATEYSVSDLSALTAMCQSVGLAFDRVDLSRKLVDQRSKDQVALLLQHSSDVIVLLDPHGTVLFASPAAHELAAAGDEGAADGPPNGTQVEGQHWVSWFTEPRHAQRLLGNARRRGTAQSDLSTASGGHGARQLDVVVTWLPDQRHFVVTHHDVTVRHQLQEELRRQAFHDPLTGLFNRTVFRQRLAREVRRTHRQPGHLVVMMMDLDDFKNVNDSLGHPAGDDLLVEVSRRILGCLGEYDLAARLGGDEFAIILDGASAVADAEQTAARILREVGRPIRLGDNDVVVSASIGIAVGDAATIEGEELERDADLALYRSKSLGKNRCTIFETEMHVDALRRMELTGELRRAVELGQLDVAYQPIVSLDTGAIAGVEALARWHHPTRGSIPPDTFIPLAEETGLIAGIGRLVLGKALADGRRWHEEHPAHTALRVAVNLSARQLSEDDAVGDVAEAVQRTGIDPRTVIIELTESALMPGEGVSTDRLAELAALGVHLFIDDFGTGWSSLQRLRALPVSGVKLPREFVTELPGPDGVGLARAVRDLTTTLGLESAVAEGIEQVEQRLALRQLGYRLGQGFLLGRPMPANELARVLRLTPSCAWDAAGAGHEPVIAFEDFAG
ncbi:MAG: putative bifunctional diguanylate cyclase/phosphodiesterase [Candidatus Nanopelagicales bacterium]